MLIYVGSKLFVTQPCWAGWRHRLNPAAVIIDLNLQLLSVDGSRRMLNTINYQI